MYINLSAISFFQKAFLHLKIDTLVEQQYWETHLDIFIYKKIKNLTFCYLEIYNFHFEIKYIAYGKI